MSDQLPDFDRLLLLVSGVLLLKVTWARYAARLRRRWQWVKAHLPRR